jgi:hypothetical protein
MNKTELKGRINKINTKTEFEDIKQILKKYLSIKERVNVLDINFMSDADKFAYYWTGSGIVENVKEIKKQLIQIVDDYSIYKEIICYLKEPFKFLAGLLGKFLDKKVSQ